MEREPCAYLDDITGWKTLDCWCQNLEERSRFRAGGGCSTFHHSPVTQGKKITFRKYLTHIIFHYPFVTTVVESRTWRLEPLATGSQHRTVLCWHSKLEEKFQHARQAWEIRKTGLNFYKPWRIAEPKPFLSCGAEMVLL